MHSKIVIFLVLLGIGLNVSAYPNFQANEDGTISGFLEAEDYGKECESSFYTNYIIVNV